MVKQNKNTMILSKRKSNRAPRASCSSLRTPTDGAAGRYGEGKHGEKRGAGKHMRGEEYGIKRDKER